jgi:hypothetical protein
MTEPDKLQRPLQPFTKQAHLSNIKLDGQARWKGGNLELHYYLNYSDDDVMLPASRESEPQRCDGLWEHTCFEAFVGKPGDQGYWEINLSPSGDWNYYRLSGYRENLQADTTVEKLAITLEKNESGLELSCTVPLGALIESDTSLEISLTAVLEHPTQGCSFWAWKHSGKEADFHLRDSLRILEPGK